MSEKNLSMDDVKELRERTGVSIMQCKKALEEAGGDLEKAIVILQKKGAATAAKKSDRTLGAGTVQAYVHSNGSVGTMVVLACETDFVAKSPEFRTLAHDIAMHITASNPEFIRKEEIDDEARKKAAEVFEKEVEGKPEDMKDKILEGKLDAYFGDKVLLDQAFVKNPDMTVEELINSFVQKFGEKIELVSYSKLAV